MSLRQSNRRIPSIDNDCAFFPLRVARSPIQGWGVFAARRIPSGRKIIEYTGERIRIPVALARLRKHFRSGSRKIYMVGFSRVWSIDPSVGGSGAELVNHSCEPNARLRKIRGHAFVVSLRKIRPGEELSYDYRLSPDTFRIRCRCSSPNCRGFLNRYQ